jgi:hypothetical protein
VNAAGLFALLPILASGYLLLRAKPFRYHTSWLSGYALYFRIAVAGLAWFCLFTGIAFLSSLPPLSHAVLFGAFIGALIARFLIIDLIFALVVRRRPDAHTRLLFSAIKDREFELHVFTALEEQIPLMLTLENRKVYVGMPSDTFSFAEPDTDKKFIRLLPLKSGFRHSQNYGVEFTTDYLEALARYGDEKTLDAALRATKNLEIVIPVRRIMTMQFFDEKIHSLFHSSPAAKGGGIESGRLSPRPPAGGG